MFRKNFQTKDIELIKLQILCFNTFYRRDGSFAEKDRESLEIIAEPRIFVNTRHSFVLNRISCQFLFLSLYRINEVRLIYIDFFNFTTLKKILQFVNSKQALIYRYIFKEKSI